MFAIRDENGGMMKSDPYIVALIVSQEDEDRGETQTIGRGLIHDTLLAYTNPLVLLNLY